MKRPRKLTLIALPLSLLLSAARPAIAQADGHPKIDAEKGWQKLFNGKDLTGWSTRKSDGKPAPADSWVVEDGVIARRGGAYLWTDKKFGDFILDMEFKIAPKTNSGIIIRHDPETKSKKRYWWDGLLEVQILDSAGKAKPNMHDSGSLYDMIAPSANAMKAPGEWNRITITARGSQITIIMNCQKIIDIDLDDWPQAGRNPDGTPNKYHKPMKDNARSGHILLQEHGHPVWFRNVSIKTLGQ